MIYGSLCSGIEAATQAWHPLGWGPAFFSEIDKFPSAVLAHHYPDVPNHGDMTRFEDWPDHASDLLVGGTPCQSFSVAGLRKGLADPRGNLMLTFGAVARRYQPRWIVWENVPGVLSSDNGRDFGTFLGMLAELGYGFAYRVLDAQYIRTRRHAWAVPQRRRRVFVVGYLGDWRRAAAVLFDGESLSGNPPPRRETGQRPAPTVSARPTGGGGLGTDFDLDGGLICANSGDVGYCLTASAQQSLDAETETLVAHALRADGFDASEDGTGRGTPIVPIDMRQASRGATMTNNRSEGSSGGAPGTGIGDVGDPSPTLSTSHVVAIAGPIGAVAFDCKAGGNTALSIGEVPGALRGDGFGGGHAAIAHQTCDRYGDDYANAKETDTAQALRTLRAAVGEETYSEWGIGIIAALRSPEVLRSRLHGSSLRREADDRIRLDDDALSCSKDRPSWAVRALWQAGCDGCPPSGWRPSKQLANELREDLSVLSQQGASPAWFLLCLRQSSEGLGLLREALSTVQEIWRPADDQGEPAHRTWAVRRLTPKEAERLQGFPDNFTRIPGASKGSWREVDDAEDIDELRAAGLPLKMKGNAWLVRDPDGPRYKALGNSMAVNVMTWIGERIELVEGGE